jgi:hypothetical protein
MATSFVECCFGQSEDAFWVPVLNAGTFCKDLARAIKERFEIVSSDIYLANPWTGVPYTGKYWIKPFEPVRVWITPLGEVPRGALCSIDWIPEKRGTSVTSEQSEETEADSGSDTDMPFYVVRVGKKPGIYLTKSEMMAQVAGVDGAQYKTFLTAVEAAAFLRLDDGIAEREHMSAGSRARHPPSKSTAPLLVDGGDAAPAEILTLLDIVFHCLLDPTDRTAYCVMHLYPQSNRRAVVTRSMEIRNAKNSARSELFSVLLALKEATDLPGYNAGRTLVRLYCMSTYATNAVNDYARNQTEFTGANAAVMSQLAGLLKTTKVRAFWTSSTDAALNEVVQKAIQVRLSHGKIANESVEDDAAEK